MAILSDGKGWYYDNFSPELKDDCQPGEQQRIQFKFADGDKDLPSGAGATFECFQPVARIDNNAKGFDAINTSCARQGRVRRPQRRRLQADLRREEQDLPDRLQSKPRLPARLGMRPPRWRRQHRRPAVLPAADLPRGQLVVVDHRAREIIVGLEV